MPKTTAATKTHAASGLFPVVAAYHDQMMA